MIPRKRLLRYLSVLIALTVLQLPAPETLVSGYQCSMPGMVAPPAVMKSSDSVFTVNVFTLTGGGRGSATYIGDGLFASAWHVVDGATEDDTITLTKPDGTCYNCTIVAFDDVWDIVLLKTEATVKEVAVKIAQEDQGSGDYFWGAGYGESMHDDEVGVELRVFGGWYKGHCRPNSQLHKGWFMFSGEAIPGDSGGAVFNNDGELVGDLWGKMSDTTFVVTNRLFRKFLIANGVEI